MTQACEAVAAATEWRCKRHRVRGCTQMRACVNERKRWEKWRAEKYATAQGAKVRAAEPITGAALPFDW